MEMKPREQQGGARLQGRAGEAGWTQAERLRAS